MIEKDILFLEEVR